MPPKTGHFVLHSSFRPRVTAGPHRFVTEQVITHDDGEVPFEVSPLTTHIDVQAPRYTMPTEQVLSTFPPANGVGNFGDRLPQIVLKRRTLPWERNPLYTSSTTEPDPNAPPPPPPPPWLALVVVAEAEAELSTPVPVKDCVTPGTPLFRPQDKDVEQGLYLAVTETVLKKVFPTRDELDMLVHTREVDVDDTELANGDDDGWMAVVLANRLPVADKVTVPNPATGQDEVVDKPVRYLACLVNVEAQLDQLPAESLVVAPNFKFELAQDWSYLATQFAGGADAVVMGTPVGGKSKPVAGVAPGPGAAGGSQLREGLAASAASLDGGRTMNSAPVADDWVQTTKKIASAARGPDAQYVVRDAMKLGFRYPIVLAAMEKVYRFPVLAHWSFTTAGRDSFEYLMQRLDSGLLGTLPAEQPGAPPRPATGPEVVATGHVGLGHRARRGDAVRAWYRGPCVPFPVPRDGRGSSAPLALAHSADQLRRVIPDGREDLALASAFEIGRLLALSQLSVVSALLRFRSEQFGAGRVRELLRRMVAYDLPQLIANAGKSYVDLGRFVAVNALDSYAQDPGRVLGPRRPIADPGRPLRVDGDLDAVIAAGLGIDLAELHERSESMGLLAALEATAVPLAGRLGATKIDARTVGALRGALQAELTRTLQVAVPPATVVVGPGVQKTAKKTATAKSKAMRGTGPAPRTRAASPPPRDPLDALIDAAPSDDTEEGDPAP